ncbi:iris-like [Haemaphysalis longicornis]
MSLVLFRPVRMDGLAQLEESLSATTITETLSKLQEIDDVELSLPLFRVKQVIDLKRITAELGFEEWNTDKVVSCAPSGSQLLPVSEARHAAAFRVCTKSGPPGANSPSKVAGQESKKKGRAKNSFTIDRPFVFLVTCRDPDVVILLGSVKSADW